MAIYDFDGSTTFSVTFDPLSDVLNITGISAADIELKKAGSSIIITDLTSSNSITLTHTKIYELTTSNIVFDDGSILLVGDDSTDKGDKFDNVIDLSTSTTDNQALGKHGDDTISMGDGNDIVKGGQGNDFLNGGGGNDYLKGGQGFDSIFGGSGDDTLKGGKQADLLDGGDGNDLLIGNQGRDTLDGGTGDDTLKGGFGRDLLDGGEGNDYLKGGFGRDTMDGGTGDDTLLGNRGRDTLDGGQGNDNLDGGRARDLLEGGAGDDTITGGLGDDTITGGSGTDSIVFNSTSDGGDLITDFDHVEGDQLLLNGGNAANEYQWGYQSTGATKANTTGTITSDFLLEATNKEALLSAISNAIGNLFGSTIASGVSSAGYFFGLTTSSSNLFYIIANQHTVTGSVTTTFSTVTVARLEGITGLGTGVDQIAQSDIILF